MLYGIDNANGATNKQGQYIYGIPPCKLPKYPPFKYSIELGIYSK